MLRIHDHDTRLCDGLTRREWVGVVGLGITGLSLLALFAARSPASARPVKPKACIVLFLLGGPPQHETWDPKLAAPPEGTLKSCDRRYR